MRPPLAILVGLMAAPLGSCDWPFNTEPTTDEPLFQVSATVSAQRLIDSAFVDLSWPVIGIDDFREFRINRRYAEPVNTDQGAWVELAIIADPRTSSWRDTIFDDEDLTYSVTVIRQDGPYGSSVVTLAVPHTTHLVVPTDMATLAAAALSPMMDDGDSVLVLPGTYVVSSLTILGKGLNIIGLEGAGSTYLEGDPLGPDSVMIRVEGGLVQGFTIEMGTALFGGGIQAGGSALLRHLVLRSNRARVGLVQPWGGFGGAAYLSDLARMENCLVFSNSAVKRGGGIFIDPNPGQVRIINCTIYGNVAEGQYTSPFFSAGGGIASNNGVARVENCIVVGNTGEDIRPLPPDIFAPAVWYTNASQEWLGVSSTNLAVDPLFLNPGGGDFRLADGSPCIDAGNPDPAYNDPDGSPNDMGAFGGPYGDWQATGSPAP